MVQLDLCNPLHPQSSPSPIWAYLLGKAALIPHLGLWTFFNEFRWSYKMMGFIVPFSHTSVIILCCPLALPWPSPWTHALISWSLFLPPDNLPLCPLIGCILLPSLSSQNISSFALKIPFLVSSHTLPPTYPPAHHTTPIKKVFNFACICLTGKGTCHQPWWLYPILEKEKLNSRVTLLLPGVCHAHLSSPTYK